MARASVAFLEVSLGVGDIRSVPEALVPRRRDSEPSEGEAPEAGKRRAGPYGVGEDEKIRQRAYEIWESEGRSGNPEDHWFRAQRELDQQGQERSDATMEDAPPAAAAEASSAATGEVPDERFTE
jgi:hypothetical protein